MGRTTAAFAAVLITPCIAFAAAPAEAGVTVTVDHWSDGDTVVTSVGKVRLIGIDTPEVGRCGYVRASNRAKRLAPAGSRITLTNPTSVQDKDRYGRLLRYVNVGTVDVGLRQIRAGAKARYDGRDGYDQHPRQYRYRTADRNYADYSC